MLINRRQRKEFHFSNNIRISGIFIALMSDMKKLSLILISLAILSGCHFQQYDTNSIYELNLPSYPNTYEAKIFNEYQTVYFDQPVVEVKSFSVDFHPDTKEEKIQDKLQAISKEYGYDILEVESSRVVSWDVDNNPLFVHILAALADVEVDGNFTEHTCKRLDAIGYKYLSNVDYADQLIKSKQAFKILDAR